MMEKQELIWVEKEFAERWKELTTKKATRDQQVEVFEKYMESVQGGIRDDFRANLDGLEEDVAVFTGLILKVKQAFQKASEAHLTASYELWEKFQGEIPSVNKKMDSLISTLKPLEEKLTTINGLLGKISTHDIDRLTRSVECLATAYGTQKEMVEFLVKHFGEEAP